MIHRCQSNFSVALATSLLVSMGFGTLADAQTAGEEPPRIIATSPANGATVVDPATKEITVTFDRDMDSGMSWTGGGPTFPNSPGGAKARWRTARTCVLPVELSSGHFYRVGINSMSYRNFRSASGIPAAITAIHFTTSGPKAAPQVPQVLSLDPANGAVDVSPAVTELRVTFSVPMDKGFSWTGGGPKFPAIPDGKKPFWIDGGKTCVLPVALKPGANYELGLNSRSYKGFQSAEGLPLEPVRYAFKTSDKP